MRLGRVGWGMVGVAAGAAMAWTYSLFEIPLYGYHSQRAEMVVFGAGAQPDSPPLVLTSADQVQASRPLIADFMTRVLNRNADECFLLDDSTVHDVLYGQTFDDVVRRTKAVYGVDISTVEPPYLWRIAELIRRSTTEK